MLLRRRAVKKTSMPVHAAVVEDDPFARLTLVEALTANGITVVYDTDSAADALKHIPSHKPDVAVLDLHLGSGPTGIDLAVALREHAPKLGVVLLTSFDDPRLLGPTLPSAPTGTQYLPKRSVTSIAVLLTAVRDAIGAAGNPVPRNRNVPPKTPDKPEIAALSDTQMDTLRLVAKGLSNAEIARQRGVSERAVEAAISRLAKQLSVPTDPLSNQRVQLANVYFRSRGMQADDT